MSGRYEHQQRQEWHQQSYSSSAANGGGGDFDLEREVRHMLPPSNASYGNGYASSVASSGLQSANMVSSVQHQKQGYSTFGSQVCMRARARVWRGALPPAILNEALVA